MTTVVIDSICCGEIVFTTWKFLEFNLVNDFGSFYGTHPWHWNFTQGKIFDGVDLRLALSFTRFSISDYFEMVPMHRLSCDYGLIFGPFRYVHVEPKQKSKWSQ